MTIHPLLFRSISRFLCWAGVAAVLVASGCNQPAPSPPGQSAATTNPLANPTVLPTADIEFLDRTEQTLVRFSYQNDEEHSDFSILESLGGGVAIFDFDQDDRLDLFLPGGGTFGDRQTAGRPSGLFRNVKEWRFDDVTIPSGAGYSRYYSHGAAAADFNEDGFCDILLTGYAGLMLYQNQGDGTFREAIETGLDDRLWSSSAAWGDFNGDGVLDLYVAHYVDWSFDNHPPCVGAPGHPREVCPPKQFEGLQDVIYFGNGDGTFRDVTIEAGLQPGGKGLGVVAADIDLDGDTDLYVANDTVGNFLYRNNGSGRFEDVSLTSGTAFSDNGTPDGSMGTDVGDFDGDGLPDIWVTNYERENNALYRNQGNGLFRHISRAAGISAIGSTYVGWGTRFLDADLDGDEDLFVTNGHVIRFPQNSPRFQRPMVLENVEGTRLINVSGRAGQFTNLPHAGRGLATGDLDGDGDEDVVISHVNQPVALLSNESAAPHHWLAVRLIGKKSARSSIGAAAVAKVGSRSMLKQIRGGSSYASTSDSKLHFGCGKASLVDELTVTWPSGSKVVLKQVTCGQVITVIEP